MLLCGFSDALVNAETAMQLLGLKCSVSFPSRVKGTHQ